MNRLLGKKSVSTGIIALVSVILVSFAFVGTVPTSCVAAVETVDVNVYWDSGCSSQVSTIDWGTIEAGSVEIIPVYMRNEGNVAITLSLDTTNWSPSTASNYISLDWNYDGGTIDPDQVILTTLELLISPNIEGITTFSFNILLTCEETAPPPLDLTPPKISITGSEHEIFIESTSVMVQWTGADEESGIDYYLVYLNNKTMIETIDNLYELSGLVEGFNNVTVTAYDKEGNFASDQIGITVDLTPPNVWIDAPSSGTELSGTQNIVFTASDAHLGEVFLYIDDKLFDVSGETSYEWDTSSVDDGFHTLKILATDEAGNVGETRIAVKTINGKTIIQKTMVSRDLLFMIGLLSVLVISSIIIFVIGYRLNHPFPRV